MDDSGIGNHELVIICAHIDAVLLAFEVCHGLRDTSTLKLIKF